MKNFGSIKKLIILLAVSISFTTAQASFADNITPANTVVEFAKSYKTSSENLLYLLLSAINEHNYLIEEIQFKTGSVLFKAYTKEFIASVSTKDGFNSFIKIVPADNNHNFSPMLLEKLHSYIEMNNSISFQKVL